MARTLSEIIANLDATNADVSSLSTTIATLKARIAVLEATPPGPVSQAELDALGTYTDALKAAADAVAAQ